MRRVTAKGLLSITFALRISDANVRMRTGNNKFACEMRSANVSGNGP